MKFYSNFLPNDVTWLSNRLNSLGYIPLQDFHNAVYSLPEYKYKSEDRKLKATLEHTLNKLKELIEKSEIKVLWAENENQALKQVHTYDKPELADKMFNDLLSSWLNETQDGQTELTVEIYPVK